MCPTCMPNRYLAFLAILPVLSGAIADATQQWYLTDATENQLTEGAEEPCLPRATEFEIALEMAQMVRDRYRRLQVASHPESSVSAAALTDVLERTRIACELGGQFDQTLRSPVWVRESGLRLKVIAVKQEFESLVAHAGQPGLPDSVIRRAADKHLPPLTLSSPPLSRCAGGREGTSESALRLTRNLHVIQAGTALLAAQRDLMAVANADADHPVQLSSKIDNLKKEATVLQKRSASALSEGRFDDADELTKNSSIVIAHVKRLLSSAWDHCGGVDEWNDSGQTVFLQSTALKCDEWLTSLKDRTVITGHAPEKQALRRLLIKKTALLRVDVAQRHAAFLFGLDDQPDDLAGQRHELVLSELELCESTEQRIVLCSRHVDCLKELAKRAAAEYDQERIPGYQLTRTRLRLLDAEILLERQRK